MTDTGWVHVRNVDIVMATATELLPVPPSGLCAYPPCRRTPEGPDTVTLHQGERAWTFCDPDCVWAFITLCRLSVVHEEEMLDWNWMP